MFASLWWFPYYRKVKLTEADFGFYLCSHCLHCHAASAGNGIPECGPERLCPCGENECLKLRE